MLTIPGYKITEKIHDGVRTTVYRAYQETTQTPVVIKILNTEYPQFRDLILFRNQYAIARNLDHPNIIKCYSLENYRNSYALILEDFGGISLSEYTKSLPLNKSEFLSIAISITLALESLYQNRIIHQDIKPQNILINPETKQVKIIDFSISSLLPKETAEIKNPNVLFGTLAYISPEQTGRMNRGIDYRTDFYSLGVTFYKLLTGQLPFDSNNPLELVHCHLAKLPKNPSEVNPTIPQTVSDIVIKLMAKTAEERYQTARGLRHDLEICQQLLLSLGEITAFELGKRDICDRFNIPEKLYGRETEVQTLLSAFDRVSSGSTEMMLVAGFSGIGKTAVVNEVHKPIVRQRGYFLAGKFDQFQRNIPFAALVQAFRNLIGQLLTESNSQLQEWKAKISEALGEQGQVIIDVLPELERIIGKQPLVAELAGNAAQNRFNLLFGKFIRVLATKEHPLVIFLDDLQWADLASLKLIQLLFSEKNTQYLFLIGAYRDNEVFPAHPLMLTLEEIRKVEATVNTITLKPINKPNLNRLVADTLSCPPDTAMPLTEFVLTKTKGNPFFTNQFLKSLHEDGLITFDFSNGYWQCDIAKVRALSLTDDIVEFMALQLQKLPETTQNVLKLAACIGNQFDLNTLAIVNETSQAETAADLWKALQFGLIIPISEVYKFFQNETANGQLGYSNRHEQLAISNELLVNYKFLHDRVQQAAYFLIPEDQKQSTHLKIGQLLLKNTPEAEQEEKIFEIVNQLNIGVELITKQTERDELAQFNLVAGRKAKDSTAYPAAFRQLHVGMALLAADSWLLQYDLTLALYVEAVEAAFLSGNFEQMEQLSQVVLQQAKTLLDTVKVYEVKIQACIAQNKPVEAVQTALGVLKLFGMRFSEKPSKLRILLSLMKTKLILIGKPIESLCELPKMTLIEKLIATRLLSKASSAAYIGIPELLPLLVFQNVNLFVRYGNNDLSAFAYAWYGLILCGIVGDIKSGYNFGELALTLLKMFNAKEIQARVSFIVYCFIKHWRIHVKETLSPLLEAYQSGLNSGDIEYAAWSAHVHCQYSYFIGYELTELDKKISFYSDAITQLKQETALNYNNIFRQTVLNLLGKADNVCLLNGEAYNEEKLLLIQLGANDKTGLFLLYLNKVILCYIFAEYQQAIENINLAKKYLEGGTALSSIPIFYLYDSLAHLATYAQAHNSERKHLLRRIAASQKKLKKWAYYAPMNFIHKFDLVEAERYRILGSYAEAMDYYDRAIAGAKENEYTNEEALANELAAQFYLSLGKEKIAQVYLTEAYYCYARWGAKAKVDDLEKRYPQLLSPILNHEKISFNKIDLTAQITNITVSSTNTGISVFLDLATITKASLAIAQEIEIEKLLPTLIQVILENVGAEIGCLILPQSNNWIVATRCIYKQQCDLQSMPLNSSQEVPVSLINYVSHTREPKLINDATTEITFAADPYIIQRQPKSILCYPIVYQGKIVGIFYLENNQTTGVFTSDRLQIISLLSNQIAISLENANLYQKSQDYATQLEQSLQTLQQTQLQLVQSEKMSALGQLVAGVAHEINNPVGFIMGNLAPAQDYVQDLINLLHLYEEKFPNPGAEIEKEIKAIDLEYLVEDLPKLILSMEEGTERIANISTSLRTFSRADTSAKLTFNIHEGIDSTIMILQHRLKANENRPEIQIVKEYGDLPPVSCYPGQLNQVFMNILANAIDALEEFNQGRSYKEIQATPNQITICTELISEQQKAIIRIKDNAMGMPESLCSRIFNHSFTTKAVGKGTGLGLSISQQIVVEKHGGQLSCTSVIGEGTEFVIEIPLT